MVGIPRKSGSADTSANSFKSSFTQMDGIEVVVQKRNWVMVRGPWIRTLALGRSRICHLHASDASKMMAFVEWTRGNRYPNTIYFLASKSSWHQHEWYVRLSFFILPLQKNSPKHAVEKLIQSQEYSSLGIPCARDAVILSFAPFTHFSRLLLLFYPYSLSSCENRN